MTRVLHKVTVVTIAATALLVASGRAMAQDVVDLGAGGSDQRWAGVMPNGLAGMSLDKGNVGSGTEPSDLIIGAPGNGTGPGHVYAIIGSGHAGDNVLSSANIVLNGGTGPDRFGFSTAAGSIRTTTSPRDLVVGAPGALGGRGAVYLYAGGLSRGQVLNTSDAKLWILGNTGDQIGTALATGDLNNDGYREIIIGAAGTGRVYIINGSSGLSGTIDLSVANANVTITGASIGDELAAGDLNNDGIYDLLIGAPLANAGAGRVYYIQGRSGPLPSGIALASGGADASFAGIDPGDNAGAALRFGDFDGDGLRDVLIGAPGGDGRPGAERANSGEAYVIWGRAAIVSMSLSAADVTFFGPAAGDLTGMQLEAGDVNRDTPNDLLFLAAGAEGGKGRIMVVYGRSRSRTGTIVDLAAGYDRGLRNSASNGSIGSMAVYEVSGEGARDIIVSYPWTETADGSQAGLVYVSLSPKLSVSRSVAFSAVPGMASSTTMQVRNPGTGSVPWSVRSLTDWLTVSPSTGVSTSTSPGSFQLTASGTGLTPGVYTATVRVTSETIHLTMYIDVEVTLTVRTQVSRIPDVNGDGVPDNPLPAARFLVGLTSMPNKGGWIDVHAGSDYQYKQSAWLRAPWPGYNLASGEVYPALGDVDGDGLDEVVIGFGPAGNGWFAILDDDAHDYAFLKWIQLDWTDYTSKKSVLYPAVGDLDGDGRDEIIIGLGGEGGGGYFRVYDDATTGFAPITWGHVDWPTYNFNNGEVHPAVGDVDGDGKAEVILGLGTGGFGWVEVMASAAGGYAHRTWLRTSDAAYNLAEGIVWPAAGDLDNDGRAELVFGLGRGGHGRAEIVDDANGGFASLRWIETGWTEYNNAVGEVHPAVGNLDGDPAAEIILGLGKYSGNGGWFLIRDDAASSYTPIGWKRVNWGDAAIDGAGTFPAIGKLR